MERRSFTHQDLQLSYLDSGGSGPVLIALHAHWMEARTFAPLAAVLAPEWRVVAWINAATATPLTLPATRARIIWMTCLHCMYIWG